MLQNTRSEMMETGCREVFVREAKLNPFLNRLNSVARSQKSLVCVGLDPDPALMPVNDIASFNRSIVDATKDLVCAFNIDSMRRVRCGEMAFASRKSPLNPLLVISRATSSAE